MMINNIENNYSQFQNEGECNAQSQPQFANPNKQGRVFGTELTNLTKIQQTQKDPKNQACNNQKKGKVLQRANTQASSFCSQPTQSTQCTTNNGIQTEGTQSQMEIQQNTMDTIPYFSQQITSVNTEMEEEEFLVDINCKDHSVGQYQRQIFDFLQTEEKNFICQSGYISSIQNDINEKMRAILIDWLVDVHLKFKLVDETLFMTVNLIDRYLSVNQINRTKLQLVGVAAMFISCKYEEIYAPVVKDFEYICDSAYAKEEILEMESKILQCVKFDLTSSSPYRFMMRYAQLCNANEKTIHLATYLLELSLIEYKMLKYIPSILGASATFLANKIINKQSWNTWQQKQSKFTEQQLQHCGKDLFALMENAIKSEKSGKHMLVAVIRKYSSPKYNEVAKIVVN